MAKPKHPVTPAIRALRAAKVEFEPHLYEYIERGGTRQSSACLGVPEHHVIKTLVLEDDSRTPFIVLMHGDREVSLKSLARHLEVKLVRPCAPEVAQKHSGYVVGGTSPFGTKRTMSTFAPPTLRVLPRLYVNGGKRGFLVAMDPADLWKTLRPAEVDCAQPV